jgi:hypothetical protein
MDTDFIERSPKTILSMGGRSNPAASNTYRTETILRSFATADKPLGRI